MIKAMEKEFELQKAFLEKQPDIHPNAITNYKAVCEKMVNVNKGAVAWVVAVISLRRENLHANRTGIVYRLESGLAVVSFNKPCLIPAIEFNRLLAKKDAISDVSENAYSYNIVSTHLLTEKMEPCDAEGVVIDTGVSDLNEKILALVKEGKFEEVAELVGASKNEKTTEHEVREEDGKFKVFKIGGDKSIKNFSTKEEAEIYIESLNM